MKPLFLILIHLTLFAAMPMQFSIPEEKVISFIPEKSRDFAIIIPGKPETYIFNTEDDYYKGYQNSYFAITCKRGGWDCLRHYEILANGCIPYFVDLEECDDNTLHDLPKNLILEAMHLEGVSYLQIDHSKFDSTRYQQILKELLAYTRDHLTTEKSAESLLDRAGYSGVGKVLYLSYDPSPDYLRCLSLIGLKKLLGSDLIDIPKIPHIYKGYPHPETLYGKGFTYTQIIDDLPIDRENIEERIQNQEFELIIYGSIHRGLLFHDLVCRYYPPEKIVYICGEDIHACEFTTYLHSSPFFLREFEGNY